MKQINTQPNKDEIKDRLIKYFSPEDCFIFIFGSRATNSARYNSDWDIGLISKNIIRGAKMEKARENLEQIRTLHSFDLVNFANTSEEFKSIALQHIEPLAGDEALINFRNAGILPAYS